MAGHHALRLALAHHSSSQDSQIPASTQGTEAGGSRVRFAEQLRYRQPPVTRARRPGRRRESRRFTEPVTLVVALEREDAVARDGMVEQHGRVWRS